MANIEFHSAVEKQLKKIPKHVRTRFYKVVEILRNDPLVGIPLQGEFKGERKYRIGDYRIVYKYFIKEKVVYIYRVEPRQGAYKN